MEAYVLKALRRHCDDVPEFLGFEDNVLFQSDVGSRRLNLQLAMSAPAASEDLLAQAVAAMFRIHRAGRAEQLEARLPHLGANDAWVQHMVNGVRRLENADSVGPGFNRFAAYEALKAQPKQFVKWDCRAGNAAVDTAGKLRWFDLEYAGVRQGAEDFAWLLADESLSVSAERSMQILKDAFDDNTPVDRSDWLQYFSLYTTFHAIERLRLIQAEVRKRGWKTKEKILDRDDVGMHLDFAMEICRKGAFFADQNDVTRPLVRVFESVEKAYKAQSETPKRVARIKVRA